MSTIHERLEEQRHKARIILARENGPGLGLIHLAKFGLIVIWLYEAIDHQLAAGTANLLFRVSVTTLPFLHMDERC